MATDNYDDLWTATPDEIARRMRHGQPTSEIWEKSRSVLEARLLLAQERTARWTMLLATATFALAVATVAVLIWGG